MLLSPDFSRRLRRFRLFSSWCAFQPPFKHPSWKSFDPWIVNDSRYTRQGKQWINDSLSHDGSTPSGDNNIMVGQASKTMKEKYRPINLHPPHPSFTSCTAYSRIYLQPPWRSLGRRHSSFRDLIQSQRGVRGGTRKRQKPTVQCNHRPFTLRRILLFRHKRLKIRNGRLHNLQRQPRARDVHRSRPVQRIQMPSLRSSTSYTFTDTSREPKTTTEAGAGANEPRMYSLGRRR